MAYEAFDAGVEPGGLRDKNEVKILICYLLKAVNKPLSFDHLNEILQRDGLVNYFEFAQAVKELLETGHIDLVENPDGPLYKVTKLGAGTAGLFERSLPFSVREKAVRTAVRLLAQLKREAENRVTITEEPSGGFRVACEILDNNDALMTVSLLVPAKEQAQAVKNEFLKDPETVYKGMLALLTGDPAALRTLPGMEKDTGR